MEIKKTYEPNANQLFESLKESNDMVEKLQAENALLRKAGDLFIGTYLFASVKGLVTQDEAVKVLEEWRAAKGEQS